MPKQNHLLDPIFRALADPSRRAVVSRLAEGPATVSELAAPFDMALPSFVQHLRVLEDSGLIKSEKTGRIRTCRLATANLAKAEQWIADCRAYWETRVDALEIFLEESKVKGESDDNG